MSSTDRNIQRALSASYWPGCAGTTRPPRFLAGRDSPAFCADGARVTLIIKDQLLHSLSASVYMVCTPAAFSNRCRWRQLVRTRVEDWRCLEEKEVSNAVRCISVRYFYGHPLDTESCFSLISLFRPSFRPLSRPLFRPLSRTTGTASTPRTDQKRH
jgi:hypothetical protein